MRAMSSALPTNSIVVTASARTVGNDLLKAFEPLAKELPTMGKVPTACLIARASGRLIPSMRSSGPRAASHRCLNSLAGEVAGEQ